MNPSIPSRLQANELASLIYADGNDISKINELLNGMPASLETHINPVNKTPCTHIGIWKPIVTKGRLFYERDMSLQQAWSLWADVHKIKAEKHGKRILLLGESVARGYFYDPYYTVASALESIIRKTDTTLDFDVIDLARTSIYYDDLLDLAIESKKLNPDEVVIFAGNNWASKMEYSLTNVDYEEMRQAFANGSFPDVKSFLEKKMDDIVYFFLQQLKKIFPSNETSVTFIIPAFNLADWKSDTAEQISASLPTNRTYDWLKARDQADKAQNNTIQLEKSARTMVRIDPSNPLGYEYLADALMKQGKYIEGKQYLEEAKDCALISRSNNSKPRCFEVVSRAIKRYASENGIQIVDLPLIFSQASPTGIPGRKLLLDYCHLSLEGINLAMRHTAAVVLENLTGIKRAITSMPDPTVLPSDRIQAIAHFCSAIHNAHYGQSSEILHYHCERAIHLDKEVQEMMKQFADFVTRKAQTVLCKEFQNIIKSGDIRQYEGGLALIHPIGKKLMDITLVDTISAILESVGIPFTSYIYQLRNQEHRVSKYRLNLLQSCYSTSCYNDFAANTKPFYLQCRSDRHDFYFIAEISSTLFFDITYRIPQGQYWENAVVVLLNEGQIPIKELPLSPKWHRQKFSIPATFLKDGVNTLRICWPFTSKDVHLGTFLNGDEALNAMFPITGEISSFTVSTLETVSKTMP